MSRSLSLLALALLAGCTTAPITPPAATPVAPPALPGMERLLNQLPETAIALLGQPRLDKPEGQSRQLQFSGSCVLDIWYYPKPGPHLVATYADARLPDGRAQAPGQCLQSLITEREVARAALAKAAAAKAAAPTRKPAAKKPARRN